jgi:hypothetical protein
MAARDGAAAADRAEGEVEPVSSPDESPARFARRGAALACALVAAACSGPATATAPAEPAAQGATKSVAPPESESEKALRELLSGMGVRLLPAERRIEVAGWVNMQRGLVEVFACAPEGKTHESVVVLDCVPSGLHAGLLALGLEPGVPVEIGTDGSYRRPTGAKVAIHVAWTTIDGVAKRCRAEEWVWDQKHERAMEPAAWIFAGSFLQKTSADATSETYAANYVKSLVTTYHDASSVLENPWQDGIDDTVYYSNERVVPPVGTPITVSFAPGS